MAVWKKKIFSRLSYKMCFITSPKLSCSWIIQSNILGLSPLYITSCCCATRTSEFHLFNLPDCYKEMYGDVNELTVFKWILVFIVKTSSFELPKGQFWSLTLPMPSCFVPHSMPEGVETTPLFSKTLHPKNLKFPCYKKTVCRFQKKLNCMKYFLFGYHDSWPMNKHFLLIFAHFGLKTTTFLNAHKNYRCKVRTLNLYGMIALFILNLKNIFIGMGEPNFWGTGGKIGLKWKMLQIPGCLGAIFLVSPGISEPV